MASVAPAAVLQASQSGDVAIGVDGPQKQPESVFFQTVSASSPDEPRVSVCNQMSQSLKRSTYELANATGNGCASGGGSVTAVCEVAAKALGKHFTCVENVRIMCATM